MTDGTNKTNVKMLDSDIDPSSEVVEKIYQIIKEHEKKSAAKQEDNVLYEVLYVGANAVGSVATYIAIASIADKISPNWKIRSAVRIGGGITSLAVGAYVRTHMKDNTILRFVGNSLIGGGTLATISGFINMSKAFHQQNKQEKTK